MRPSIETEFVSTAGGVRRLSFWTPRGSTSTVPNVGSLDEFKFTELVGVGCPACGAKKLVIRSYVEGKFPIMGGEPVGPVTWAYKGETFVDGVFEIRCAGCDTVAF